MKPRLHFVRGPGRGFTLIELLVAVTITAVMVGLMLSVVTQTLTIWNRVSGDLSAENKARQIMNLIAGDFRAAVMRADGNVWLAATLQTTGGATGMTGETWDGGKPAGGSVNLAAAQGRPDDLFEDARFGQAGMWLRLFTVESAQGSEAAPRAVSYQIVRREIGGSIHYQLYRSSVEPDETFKAGYDLFRSTGATPSYNSAGTSEDAGHPGDIRRPRPDFLLADDVIDFGVRFWSGDGSATLLFPQEADDFGFAATTDATKVPPGGTGSGTLRRGFPAKADVYVRILTAAGVRQIQALESGQTSGDWWEIAEAHSRVYIQRVALAGRAL